MAEGAWVPAFDSLWASQKTARVAREMKTSIDVAGSKFLRLMAWMRDHTPSGDLEGVDRATLARAIGLATERDKDDVAGARGEAFVHALVEANFVSRDARQHVKGWEEGPGRLVNKREEDRLRKEHDRSGHPSAIIACPRCRRSSDGQGANTPVNTGRSARAPESVQRKSVGRPMEVPRTERTGTTEQTEQGTPYPRSVDRTGLRPIREAVASVLTEPLEGEAREERLLAVMPTLAEADDEWRGALEDVACRMLNSQAFETWFQKTRLERTTVGAIVRFPNAFAREWVQKKYAQLVERALDVPSGSVLYLLEGEELAELEGAAAGAKDAAK